MGDQLKIGEVVLFEQLSAVRGIRWQVEEVAIFRSRSSGL